MFASQIVQLFTSISPEAILDLLGVLRVQVWIWLRLQSVSIRREVRATSLLRWST